MTAYLYPSARWPAVCSRCAASIPAESPRVYVRGEGGSSYWHPPCYDLDGRPAGPPKPPIGAGGSGATPTPLPNPAPTSSAQSASTPPFVTASAIPSGPSAGSPVEGQPLRIAIEPVSVSVEIERIAELAPGVVVRKLARLQTRTPAEHYRTDARALREEAAKIVSDGGWGFSDPEQQAVANARELLDRAEQAADRAVTLLAATDGQEEAALTGAERERARLAARRAAPGVEV